MRCYCKIWLLAKHTVPACAADALRMPACLMRASEGINILVRGYSKDWLWSLLSKVTIGLGLICACLGSRTIFFLIIIIKQQDGGN